MPGNPAGCNIAQTVTVIVDEYQELLTLRAGRVFPDPDRLDKLRVEFKIDHHIGPVVVRKSDWYWFYFLTLESFYFGPI